MKKSKQIFSFLCAVSMLSSLGFSACGDNGGEKKDNNKTQLYVANYTGGVGSYWLDQVKVRFEEKYKDVSFEEGKVGVQVMASSDKKYNDIKDTIKTDAYEVYFTQGVDYFSWVNLGLLHDLTGVMNKVNPDDGKKIIDKLYDSDKTNYAIDGKYYALPNNSFYQGISYDAGLFESKNFYFSDSIDSEDTQYPGTRSFVVNKSTKKSCGPNGIYGDYDDGLPSSFMEFHKLIDYMSINNCDPFIWSGNSNHYANMLIGSLWANYAGIDGFAANFLFDSNGETVEVVTGWNGNTPKTENKVISYEENNGYLARDSVGLYYALELAEKVFGNEAYYQPGCTSGTVSNISAMSKYMLSGLTGNDPVAMILDGSYWYNEAEQDGIFERTEKQFSETYKNKKIRFMPLPNQYAGTVTEGNGKAPVLFDSYQSLAIINGNIKPEKVEVAETFLAYCYSDEALVNFTKETNGNLRGVKYDYSSVKDELPEFAKSVLDMYEIASKAGTYIRVMANNNIYKMYETKFTMSTIGTYETTVGSDKYANPAPTFEQKVVTAKQYFEGMRISKTQWDSSYGKSK